jgi:adenylate cyclase class 2
MLEVEVKSRIDLSHAHEILDRLGAKFLETEEHFDIYYNAPHRDFAETDEALRIRSVNDRQVLTYKGKKLDDITKSREEIQTHVEAEAMIQILERLGFKETARVQKVRDVFKIGDITLCLDEVGSLGQFIEFEIISDADMEESKKHIFAMMEKFGLKPEDSIRKSYLELVME